MSPPKVSNIDWFSHLVLNRIRSDNDKMDFEEHLTTLFEAALCPLDDEDSELVDEEPLVHIPFPPPLSACDDTQHPNTHALIQVRHRTRDGSHPPPEGRQGLLRRT